MILEGILVPTPDATFPSEADLQQALLENLGDIEQVPPQYSAVKIQGRQAYKLARQGKQVELKPRVVTIHQFQLLDYAAPHWEVSIECGSGTYIRSLGRDLGQHFGCGAVMTSLRREAIGHFTLQQAVSLGDLEAGAWRKHLLPLRTAAVELPSFFCDATEAENIRHGKTISDQL